MLGTNGNAHLTIFVNDTSFVWDGGDKVEVSPGGYGEPVTDIIDLITDHKNLSVVEALDLLTVIADRY